MLLKKCAKICCSKINIHKQFKKMTAPSIIEGSSQAVGSALSVKNLLVLTIVTIIVTLIVSKALKNTVVLTDANGNKLAEGEIKTKLAFGLKS